MPNLKDVFETKVQKVDETNLVPNNQVKRLAALIQSELNIEEVVTPMKFGQNFIVPMYIPSK